MKSNFQWKTFSLAAAVVISFNAVAQEYTAAELRNELQLWSLVNSGKATLQEHLRVGHAIGFIEGFSDEYLIERVRGARPAQDSLTFCLPKSYTIGDLRRVSEDFLNRRREPHIDNAPASSILAMAFHEVYPCRKR